MKRLTERWTTALATAALIALPVVGGAQTPQTPPEPQPEQSTTLSTPAEQDQNQNESPAQHLNQAKAALASIDAESVPARAKSKLAELRRHINALERSVAANDSASATGEAQRSSKATGKARGNVNWAKEVAAIDRIITELAGSGSTSMTESGEPGAVGTSGTEPRATDRPKSSGAVVLDDAAKNHLLEVRTHITAFAAAMSGTGPAPSSGATEQSAATEQPAALEPGSPQAEQTTPPTDQPQAEPTPTDATQTEPAQTEPQTAGEPQAPAAPGQIDEEAAKRHLTAARDALTQLTQLPAAAQLQGDARTQVSQLIQNFNELITTQADWRTTYAKLEANLTALIGPPPGAPATMTSPAPPPTETPETPAPEQPTPEQPAPATPPTTQPDVPSPTGTQGQGTPGTAGTSGMEPAALDPAIRQKLVEFRQHLLAFQTAAGGGEPK